MTAAILDLFTGTGRPDVMALPFLGEATCAPMEVRYPKSIECPRCHRLYPGRGFSSHVFACVALPARFEASHVKADTCWLWLGPFSPQGYGRLGHHYAHRVAYELYVGPIPEGLTIDHLCRVTMCVNPAHLEAVTLAENIRRASVRTVCKRGHPFVEDNIYVRPDTRKRQCLTCLRMRSVINNARQRTA